MFPGGPMTFIVVLVLGVLLFAGITIILRARDRAAGAPRGKCAHCGQRNRRNANFCASCGKELA